MCGETVKIRLRLSAPSGGGGGAWMPPRTLDRNARADYNSKRGYPQIPQVAGPAGTAAAGR